LRNFENSWEIPAATHRMQFSSAPDPAMWPISGTHSQFTWRMGKKSTSFLQSLQALSNR